MIKVIDNFLNPGYYNELEDLVYSHKFEWGYQADLYGGIFSHGITNNGQVDSKHINFFKAMLYDINAIAGGAGINRARFDMTMKDSKTHWPHVDQFNPHIASVFYVGEFDGGTEVYEERYSSSDKNMPEEFTLDMVVDPIPNRLVFFDGNIYHSGVAPLKSERRIILNTNIIRP